jgi:primosomal protein N'
VLGIVPAPLVDFADELAHYYLSSPVPFLRAASPDHIIAPGLVSYSEQKQYAQHSETCMYVDPRADRRELIKDNISESGSTILVTPQNHYRLAQWLDQLAINNTVIVPHGKTEKASFIAASKSKTVVVGGRASLFAPVSDCHSIIVLDDAYEQLSEERSPKWNATDVARMYARHFSIPLTVITSVPSSSTYGMTVIDKRIKQSWPSISIFDLSESDPNLGTFQIDIVRSIRSSIDEGSNAAIVVHSATASRMMICVQCGEIATCEQCSRSVVLKNLEDTTLLCETCHHKNAYICRHCHGTKFKKRRKGLGSLVEEARNLFLDADIVEVRAGTKTENSNVSAKPAVFVGTEALMHRDDLMRNISHVVFIDFDSTIYRPGFTAFTQTLVLVNRAMRAMKKTEHRRPITICTRTPRHVLIEDIAAGDFVSHFTRDITLRRQLGFAPFAATAEIETDKAHRDELVDLLDSTIISGTTDADPRYGVFLKAPNHEMLKQVAYQAVRKIAAQSRCTISIDSYD